jgi:hypothetical protein
MENPRQLDQMPVALRSCFTARDDFPLSTSNYSGEYPFIFSSALHYEVLELAIGAL